MPAVVPCLTIPDDAQQLLELARQAFHEKFSGLPTHAACAPGRVNLIGEHTDYNDGFVLPMALPLVTLTVGRLNGSSEINVYTLSSGMEDTAVVSFTAPSAEAHLTPGQPSWANYIKGVVAHYPVVVSGFDMVVVTSVPLGGGLSSSAALEVATFTLLEAMFPVEISEKDKALICQKAEHTFAGMPCGIMDQFISTMGTKDHALLIDCMLMEARLVKLAMHDKSVLIINSNVKHQLSGSEYPTRRRHCAEAASALGVKSLRHADVKLLQEHKTILSDEVYRRARHAITENSRTLDAVQALENNEFHLFGQLMNASHASLRDDFEVSCAELDELVNIAQSLPGVYGSRMTGGGFGGCTVTLCDSAALDHIIQTVHKKYSGKATCMVATAADGARIIAL